MREDVNYRDVKKLLALELLGASAAKKIDVLEILKSTGCHK
jgi:hypothetical protein